MHVQTAQYKVLPYSSSSNLIFVFIYLFRIIIFSIRRVYSEQVHIMQLNKLNWTNSSKHKPSILLLRSSCRSKLSAQSMKRQRTPCRHRRNVHRSCRCQHSRVARRNLSGNRRYSTHAIIFRHDIHEMTSIRSHHTYKKLQIMSFLSSLLVNYFRQPAADVSALPVPGVRYLTSISSQNPSVKIVIFFYILCTILCHGWPQVNWSHMFPFLCLSFLLRDLA